MSVNSYHDPILGLYMMASGVRAGQLTARKVKNMVAELDEKLSDNGAGQDVEDNGQDSRGNSDESGSETDERQVQVHLAVDFRTNL